MDFGDVRNHLSPDVKPPQVKSQRQRKQIFIPVLGRRCFSWSCSLMSPLSLSDRRAPPCCPVGHNANQVFREGTLWESKGKKPLKDQDFAKVGKYLFCLRWYFCFDNITLSLIAAVQICYVRLTWPISYLGEECFCY